MLLRSLVLLLLFVCGPAFAFGGAAHRLIADLALERVTPAARSELSKLLALEPGATLASISTWADEVRAPSTAAWHYVNLPRDSGCRYDAARDCPDGRCVVGAIERQAAVLASSAPDVERLKALKYLVHLVGDVHQPLHAGFAEDRGGNLYQVRSGGRGTNLHAMWDVGLVEQWPGGLEALRDALKPAATAAGEGRMEPASWAEESCRIVSTAGFYPDGHFLPADYGQRFAPVLRERLAAAGQRLAVILNRTLVRP